jgi:hypothetical protein
MFNLTGQTSFLDGEFLAAADAGPMFSRRLQSSKHSNLERHYSLPFEKGPGVLNFILQGLYSAKCEI